jgi:hypothetical protein
MRDLRAALDAGAALDPCPLVRGGGVRVIVRGGPYRGLAGVAERLADSGAEAARLVFQVQALGRAVSLAICEADLECEALARPGPHA